MHRRIGDRDQGLGLEAVVGFFDRVFLRQRLIDLSERAFVHEGEMRVVEGVFHQPQRGRVPFFIELRNPPVGRIVLLLGVEDRRQRLVERDPGVAVPRGAVIGRRREVRYLLLDGKLRHVHQLAGAVVGPAVIAADDLAVVHPALRQLGGAVTASVLQGRRIAVLVEEHDDVLAEQAEWFRPVLKVLQRDDRIPEPPQHLLLGREHRVVSGKIQVSFSTALSCHEPSASFDRPTISRNSIMPATVIRNSAANMRGISSWKPACRIS